MIEGGLIVANNYILSLQTIAECTKWMDPTTWNAYHIGKYQMHE